MSSNIRLGYVANALRLPNSSPNRSTTAATAQRLPREDRFSYLARLGRDNLRNTLRILRQNALDGILVYRLTSRLVPLATHALAEGWDYAWEFRHELNEIGVFARAKSMRLSAHPDHFTLLNSPRPEVTESALRDLEYHDRILTGMGLPDARLVMHVGGGYRDPETAKARFLANLSRVPANIVARLALENDDRSYNAEEVLEICRIARLPMVLDLHHHSILPGHLPLRKLIPAVLATWGPDRPKFHFSSPRSPTAPRSHADCIEARPFLEFARLAAQYTSGFDVMLEAKAKDLALLKLGEDLAGSPGVRILSPGEIEILV